MSYSFSVRAANRSDVMERVTAEFDIVVAGQPALIQAVDDLVPDAIPPAPAA